MQPQPQVFLRPPPTLNPLAAGLVNRFVTTAEEDEEFRMTFGNKKKSFNIFQDVPGLQAEVSPGRTESPLEEHRYVMGVYVHSSSKVQHQTNPVTSQIRLPKSQLAFISEQFDQREPYPTIPNTSGQAAFISQLWKREHAT
jgi:hypothetical protein